MDTDINFSEIIVFILEVVIIVMFLKLLYSYDNSLKEISKTLQIIAKNQEKNDEKKED